MPTSTMKLGALGCLISAASASLAVPGLPFDNEYAAQSLESQRRATSLKGKSVYFLMVDRFARSDGNDTACEGRRWCNGTLRGLTANLDYIQGMGFDCVWITPVIAQWQGYDNESGSGYHGYWAENLFAIDHHFGNSKDLKELSDALHSRGMCLMMDMVVNHVRPIYSVSDVSHMVPFDDPSHYNTLGKLENESYDDYFEHPVNAFTQLGQNPPPSRPYCSVGDYVCEGYNEEGVQRGWFVSLGDLNQSNAVVRSALLHWVKFMVNVYNLDAIRLDTAQFVEQQFLAEFQTAAGVPILGEVTSTNMSFHASYMNRLDSGHHVLDGVLNFPLSEVALASFCGTDFPGATRNLTRLGADMALQLAAHEAMYRDIDLLGNFVDNHDFVPRVAEACQSEESRVANAITWVMLYRGIPVIYYGTEHLFLGSEVSGRSSLWRTGFDTSTPLYRLLAELNRLRHHRSLGVAAAAVEWADDQHLVFTRGGSGPGGTWVYVNSRNASSEPVRYCAEAALPPEPPSGDGWIDALTGEDAKFEGDCFVAEDTQPKVLVLKSGYMTKEDAYSSSSLEMYPSGTTLCLSLFVLMACLDLRRGL